MTFIPKESVSPSNQARSKKGRNVAIFASLITVWLVSDIISKQIFTRAFTAGKVSGESILGLFQFTLVHNSGAAWGIFGDSTGILAVISLVISGLIFVYFVSISARANVGEVAGLAFIIAGGIGNAIDRFTLGYVVDFIEFSFIEFPVFNIADIGVTCGFAILLISIIYSWIKEDQARKNRKASLNDVEAQ